MAVDMLLREGRINTMKLRNLIITGPMEKTLANRDGSLTTRYIDFLKGAPSRKGNPGRHETSLKPPARNGLILLLLNEV
jgi:hypothetical protein